MKIKVYETDGVIFCNGNEVEVPKKVVDVEDYINLRLELMHARAMLSDICSSMSRTVDEYEIDK